MTKVPFIILGSALVLWGIRICVDPVYYSSKFGVVFDYSGGMNIPFGLVTVFVGGFFIWTSIRKK